MPSIDIPSLTARIGCRDLQRAARSLASRSDQIMGRRDKDPILRAAAEAEAAFCRRIAAMISAAVRDAE